MILTLCRNEIKKRRRQYDPAFVPEPGKYDIELKLEKENIDALVQAKKSLNEDDHLVVKGSNDLNESNIIEFIFGADNEYSNKISYKIKVDNYKHD